MDHLEAVEARLAPPESAFRYVGSLSTDELFGDILPHRSDLRQRPPDVQKGAVFYQKLGKALLHPFVSENPQTGKREYIVVCSRVTGEAINGMLYLAAPSKSFGYDTGDIVDDWTSLYTDPSNAERLARHRQIDGWSDFERYREPVLAVLQDFYQRRGGASLVPVIRWKVNSKGEREWIFEPLDLETHAAVIAELSALEPDKEHNVDRYIPTLGLMHVATFSPEITTSWPTFIGQNMGATQAMPLTLMKRGELSASRFVERLERYVATGQVPAIEVQETVEEPVESDERPNIIIDPAYLPPYVSLNNLPGQNGTPEKNFIIKPPTIKNKPKFVNPINKFPDIEPLYPTKIGGDTSLAELPGGQGPLINSYKLPIIAPTLQSPSGITLFQQLQLLKK